MEALAAPEEPGCRGEPAMAPELPPVQVAVDLPSREMRACWHALVARQARNYQLDFRWQGMRGIVTDRGTLPPSVAPLSTSVTYCQVH